MPRIFCRQRGGGVHVGQEEVVETGVAGVGGTIFHHRLSPAESKVGGRGLQTDRSLVLVGEAARA